MHSQFYGQYGLEFGLVDDKFIDYGAPLMIMVIKLSNFAWACHDGTRPEKDLNQEQKLYAIRSPPTILEFLGYAFFYGGFFIGPAFEFRDYRMFINQEAPFDKIPSTTLPTLINAAFSIVCCVIYFRFKPTAWAEYALTKDFTAQYNLIQRCVAIKKVDLKGWGISWLLDYSCDVFTTLPGR